MAKFKHFASLVLILFTSLLLLVSFQNFTPQNFGKSTAASESSPADFEDEDDEIDSASTDSKLLKMAQSGRKPGPAGQYLVINNSKIDYVPELVKTFGRGTGTRRLGSSVVLRPFGNDSDSSLENTLLRLNEAFAQAEKWDVPLWIHIDNELSTLKRPDLWNWFDKDAPGYDYNNRFNVEWSSWTEPTKVFYLNWNGVRKLNPKLAFSSQRVRQEVRNNEIVIAAAINKWRTHLIENQRHYLFLGVSPGWETGIPNLNNGGQTAWVPNGSDPNFPNGRFNLGFRELLDRGFSASNPPTDPEREIIKGVHDWVRFMTGVLADQGIPKNKIYSHIAGFEGMSLAPMNNRSPLSVANNEFSRQGYSLYPGAYDYQAVMKITKGKIWGLSEAPPTNDVARFLQLPNLKVAVLYSWDANIKDFPGTISMIKNWLSEGSTEALKLKKVYRYYHEKNHDYWLTTDTDKPVKLGYKLDKVAFNIYNVQRKGLMGLWDCIYLGEHFLSTKSNCEGQGVVGLIGYIPKKEKTFGVQNIRLYRFFNETIRDHLATTDRDDSVLNDKYKPEGVYGFVPTALGVDPTPGPIPEGQ